MDPKYYFEMKRRGSLHAVPGLVRMDRALIYIKQKLEGLIRELNQKETKFIGEFNWKLQRFAREVLDMCSMSGDTVLGEMVCSPVFALRDRTLRIDALLELKRLAKSIETYTPISEPELEGVQELKDKLSYLESKLTDEVKQETSPTFVDTSDQDSIFVIMPFDISFRDVWDGGIRKAVQQEGMKPI